MYDMCSNPWMIRGLVPAKRPLRTPAAICHRGFSCIIAPDMWRRSCWCIHVVAFLVSPTECRTHLERGEYTSIMQDAPYVPRTSLVVDRLGLKRVIDVLKNESMVAII